MGETQIDMEFKQGYYGPYSSRARFLLDAMNGYYIRGMEQMDAKPFEALELLPGKRPELNAYIEENLSVRQKGNLKKLTELIDGFQTAYGMELLASVDYIRRKYQVHSSEKIATQLALWSDRKAQLFPHNHIVIAQKHLDKHLEY
jgi:hypothetical protein